MGMEEWFNDICAFHEKHQLEYDGGERALPDDLAKFRADFMIEELGEYEAAALAGNRASALDALVDLAYVAVGTAYLHGFPIRPQSTWPLHVQVAIMPPDTPLDPNSLEGELVLGMIDEPVREYFVARLLRSFPERIHRSRESVWEVAFRAWAGAQILGYDFDEAWRRVHAANMKKVRAPSARSGSHDVVKPPGWTAPNLADLVR